ncbi:unnamed protein product [Durusdinium trenchii]
MAGNVTEMAPNVQMSFTVLVALPETAKWPVHHVWSLTLCRSACTGNLSQEISFNLLGFLEGEAHPGWQSTETNGVERARQCSAWLGLMSLAALGLR